MMTSAFATPETPDITDLIEARSIFDPANDVSVQLAIGEYRQKPTIHPITGEWTTCLAEITKDASGRIVAERLTPIEGV